MSKTVFNAGGERYGSGLDRMPLVMHPDRA